MPVITPVPFTVPAHEEHSVAAMPARNWTEPSVSTNDIGGPRNDRIQIDVAAPLTPIQEVPETPAPQDDDTTSSKDSGPLQIFYFEIQSAVLETTASDKADALKPTGQCYLVIGHADPTGTPRMIGPLSLERARNVAQLLRQKGAKLVNESGDGAAQPPKGPEAWPQERRAEVYPADCAVEPES